MPTSAKNKPKETDDDGVECPDCNLRHDQKQANFLRLRHNQRGRLLPNGRLLSERCESCGGGGRVVAERAW
jgi:hypothetical protein